MGKPTPKKTTIINEQSVGLITFGDPHPAHKGFGKAVGADIVSLPEIESLTGTAFGDVLNILRVSVPDYDVYLLEGASELYLVPLLAPRDATIVAICDDHRIYGLRSYVFGGKKWITRLIKRFDRGIDTRATRLSANRVDGIIAGSALLADVAEAVTSPDIPVRVASPYIQPDVYQQLGDVEPILNKNTAVTVSVGRGHKGVDRLVNSWPAVRDVHPNAELRVVGPGHPKQYERVSGVEVTGYVEPSRLQKALAPASLYVHPARVEAFGVTVVEAMRAGLPAIVTRTTGARSTVRDLRHDLVVEPTQSAIIEGVIKYFGTDLDHRHEFSEAAREAAELHRPDVSKERFKQQFGSILQTAQE